MLFLLNSICCFIQADLLIFYRFHFPFLFLRLSLLRGKEYIRECFKFFYPFYLNQSLFVKHHESIWKLRSYQHQFLKKIINYFRFIIKLVKKSLVQIFYPFSIQILVLLQVLFIIKRYPL